MNDLASKLANLTPAQRAGLSARLKPHAAPPPPDAIAIIGVGCRFPGGAVSPEAFWDRLLDGMDAVREVPADRWAASAHPNLSRWGAFLDNVDQFDPDFFGLSPREAAHMDPQQRLLLETAWEALEDAGQMTDGLAQSATGVFIGAHGHSIDYYLLQAEGTGGLDTYTATGTAHSILANRLSFLLDLRGPSMAIDTACSSSLVAVHAACQNLRTGDCDMALAGGVNLMLAPQFQACLSSMEMMAPDGRCKTFDHRANGFVRGEGCGVVVLKRFADAQRDGDDVLALILGGAVNQDGASNGLTAPNGLAQQAVIRRALAAAQVAPDEVSYVETHGTGTELGDPIEVEALASVLHAGDRPRAPCVLGALKTNIGHLEGASGIASLIKVVLCLKHDTIPANLHLEAANPHLADNMARFSLPSAPLPWPRSDRRRVAGISSFGFGGSNAHVIVAEAPLVQAEPRPAASDTPYLLPLSARSEGALRNLADGYADFLTGPGARMAAVDIAYTTAHRRLHHDHRLCVVGTGAVEWAASLRRGRTEINRSSAAGAAPEIVFVFSGQGGQRPQAGAQLLESEPVFRQVIEACDAALRRYAPISLIDEIFAPAPRSRLARADVGQPAQFALQAGLDALWRSWGIEPTKVVGHSLGEIAAAHSAGALSLDDAMRVAFHRGRILQGAAGLGGMAMVGLPLDEIAALIAEHDPSITIAAYNSPISCILAGPLPSLHAAVAELHGRSVFARMLDTDYPSHSPSMKPFAAELADALAGLVPLPPTIPIVSSVTGRLSERGAFDAAYWARNLCEPVQFVGAIETILLDGGSTFLEIGPQPVLRPALEQCEIDAENPVTVAASLARDLSDRHAMMEGAAALYQAGATLDWTKLAPPTGRLVVLPRYPWDRRRCWLPTRPAETGPSTAATETAPTSWFYELAWRTEDSKVPRTSTFASIDLNSSAARLEQRVAALSEPREDDSKLNEWLNAVSVRYIFNALGELGADTSIGARWPKQELARSLGAKPRFERLLRRMHHILLEQRVLVEDSDRWTVVKQPMGVSPDWRPQTGDRTEPASSLLMRCGPQLSGVLRGEIEPLALLFPDDAGSSAEAIYRDATPSRRSNQVLAAAVQDWLSGQPKDSRLRIIEIGAGTGATTVEILPLLPADRCDYVFTDVSPLFLRRAAERFSAFPFVRYELLDLEGESAAEDLTASFDLVIAANVLHATSDVRAGVARIRELLADGGVAALVECTVARPWMDITFGLTDGWWQFADLRNTHPLLDQAQWADALRMCGFSETKAIALQLSGGDPIFDQALMLARRPTANRHQATPTPARYLIVDEGCAAAPLMAEKLRARGDDCRVVEADARRAISEATSDLRAVIYFAAETSSDLATGGFGLVTLAQALARADAAPARGLWIVTRGCQPCGEIDSAALGQSIVWGLGRGISLEFPDLAPTLIDLDPEEDAATAIGRLIEELDHPREEDQIVLRGDTLQFPRVRPLAPETRKTATWEIRGRHLITGGLGGIGSRLALELARAGADELVLTVNRPLPDRSEWDRFAPGDADHHRIEAVRQLEALGASVQVAPLDLTDEQALDALFASPALAGRPLNGVWHAAMVLQPQDLADIDEDTFASMVAVKARAALQLHELTRLQRLDQFVLFSSTTALWGARGLAHYAAANAFLDALAHLRSSEGLAATAVNWGTWEVVEQLPGAQRSLAQRAGLRPMRTAAAFAALKQAVASGRTQTIVADVDWDQFTSAYEARRERPLLAEINASRANDNAEPRQLETTAWKLGPSSQDRNETIRDLVTRSLADVLGIDPQHRIDRNRGFFDLGMDSLTSVQLRRRLEAALGVRLATTVAFKYPTIDSLTAHLGDKIFPPLAATIPTIEPSREASTSDQDEASEAELFGLLASRLSEYRTQRRD